MPEPCRNGQGAVADITIRTKKHLLLWGLQNILALSTMFSPMK